VDDHPANRSAFQALLEPLGFRIFLASSGEEALTRVTRTRFSAIILDVRMPIMDGLETAVYLRKKPFSRKTPIIFVSAHQNTAQEVSRLSLDGPIGYVHSPVDSELLVWRVKNSVDYFLKEEKLRSQASRVWQARNEFLTCLQADSKAPPGIRRSGLRLGAVLENLREAFSDRLGVLNELAREEALLPRPRIRPLPSIPGAPAAPESLRDSKGPTVIPGSPQNGSDTKGTSG
jgi:CheY-like chemotaxis protein